MTPSNRIVIEVGPKRFNGKNRAWAWKPVASRLIFLGYSISEIVHRPLAIYVDVTGVINESMKSFQTPMKTQIIVVQALLNSWMDDTGWEVKGISHR